MLQRADELFLNRMYRNLPQSLQKHAKRLWRACVQWSLAKHDAANVTSFSGPQAVSSPLSSTNDVCNRMNSPASLPQGQLLDEYRISNLMYIIWLSRPDLQRAFDLSTAAGQRDFVNWYLCSVEREYGIAPNVPGAGAEAPSHLENRFQFSADGGRGRLLQLIAGENGANLVAYAHAEMGMGELVRMSAAALSCTDVNFGIVNFDYGTRDRKTAILPHGHLEPDNRYKVNIFHINADQMLHAYCGLGGEFFSGRYNIGFWTCELEKCPDAWVPVIGMVDEIWAPSRFIQAAFAARASVPVIHMPLCVWVPDHGAHSREHFGLPSHRFLFLFTFDGFSYPERKNPIGVVRAFRHAFPDPKVEVGLVLKAMNCDKSSEAWMKLQEVIAADPRIVVIDQTMDRGELLGLVGVCDCYVSLHRSEGFARGAAEAMYLGKPVIVTNYSGPTDFVRPDNACLVSFRLVPVNAGEYPFHEGQTWADPDLDEAAWYMKKIFTDREFARKIGTCARSYMQENFSRRVVGARYADRLRELGLA
jgi:glycosyltransferase involved in cell wall biosynthesis